MNILVAPDSFKESMTAKEASEAIRFGWLEARPQDSVWTVPVSDGGEGSAEVFLEATNGTWKYVEITGPLGESVQAKYALSESKAFIEIAEAAGLHLVPLDRRNPGITTTYGVGELIKDALDQGVRSIIIGLGGSATNDGGVGIAVALGAKFLDNNDVEFLPVGENLSSIEKIDLDDVHPSLRDCQFEVACDVDNPLTGINGAAAIFGGQKGANSEQIEELDREMGAYCNIVRECFNIDLNDKPGSGAAGGIGALAIWFLKADLQPGVDILFKLIELETWVKKVDLVITGEGKIDSQSLHGKAPYAIAKMARKYDVPVLGIAGYVDFAVRKPFDALFSITPGAVSLEQSFTHAVTYTYETTRNIAQIWNLMS